MLQKKGSMEYVELMYIYVKKKYVAYLFTRVWSM